MLSKNKSKFQKGGNADLLRAVKENDYESVKDMLSKNDPNIDVNFIELDTTTPLIAAIKNNNYIIVKDLLEHGADCNYVNRFRKTPLMFAAITLLKLINKKTPIQYTAGQRSIYNIMKLLLIHGAIVNTMQFKTFKKKSPFYLLCYEWFSHDKLVLYKVIKKFVHKLWQYDKTILNTLRPHMQKKFKKEFPMNFQQPNIAQSEPNIAPSKKNKRVKHISWNETATISNGTKINIKKLNGISEKTKLFQEYLLIITNKLFNKKSSKEKIYILIDFYSKMQITQLNDLEDNLNNLIDRIVDSSSSVTVLNYHTFKELFIFNKEDIDFLMYNRNFLMKYKETLQQENSNNLNDNGGGGASANRKTITISIKSNIEGKFTVYLSNLLANNPPQILYKIIRGRDIVTLKIFKQKLKEVIDNLANEAGNLVYIQINQVKQLIEIRCTVQLINKFKEQFEFINQELQHISGDSGGNGNDGGGGGASANI